MIDRFNQSHRTTANLDYTLRWVNTSDEVVPAYGVVQFKANYAGTNQASKPSAGSGLFFANVANDVASGYPGEARLWNQPRLVLIEGSPTVGDEVGPSDDSWAMSSAGTGFRVIHQVVGGVGTVVSVGGGGGDTVNLLHGIVTANLGCGYYEIELSQWSGLTPVPPGVSGSSSEVDECDICNVLVGGSGEEPCTVDQTLPVFEEEESDDTPEIVKRQTTGTGVIVLAFDAQSRFVPLELWSDCLLANLGDTNAASGSGSGSSSSGDTEPVYQVVRGFQEHLIQYRERWECCDGIDTMVGRTPIIFPGVECEEEICNACGEA